jgi:hypothetical protein
MERIKMWGKYSREMVTLRDLIHDRQKIQDEPTQCRAAPKRGETPVAKYKRLKNNKAYTCWKSAYLAAIDLEILLSQLRLPIELREPTVEI